MTVVFQGSFYWFVATVSFIFYLSLSVSFGIFTQQIMRDLGADTTQVGHLIAASAYLHAILQVPAGLVVDRFGARAVYVVGCVISGCAGLMLMSAHSFYDAVAYRLVMGFGSAFTFVSLTYLVANWLPSRIFGFMVSMTEMLAILTVCGLEIYLSYNIHIYSWRECVYVVSIAMFVVAFINLVLVRDFPSFMQTEYRRHTISGIVREVTDLLSDWRLWYNGLYSGALFAILIGFCASWGTYFFKVARSLTLHEASHFTAMFMFGMVIGAPFFGWLTTFMKRLVDVMQLVALWLAVVMTAVIAFPAMSQILLLTAMFIMGISAGAYLLPFVVARDLVPAGAKTSVIGVTNLFSVICGPVLISVSSKLLELIANTDQVKTLTYDAVHYQIALSIYPLMLLLGAYFARKLAQSEVAN